MNDQLVSQMAAKAVIVNEDGKILILREAKDYADGVNTGKYHTPGGRLEKGESYPDGLAREIMEETGLKVEPQYPLLVAEWRPVIRDVPHHIIAVFTLCKLKGKGVVRVSNEHDEALWIDPLEAKKYALLPAEAKAVEAYITRCL